MRDCHAKGASTKVVQWLRRRRFKTTFQRGIEDCVSFSEDETGGGEVCINTRFSPEAQLYTLLHEAGHVLNHQRKDKNFHYTMLRNGRTKMSKIYMVAEELKAWEQGRRLAKRLKLRINKTCYEKLTSRYVMTYIKWIAKLWA